MTNVDFSISEDTQATLLLCGTLGKNVGEVNPLTLPQYNHVVQALTKLDKRPSNFLHEQDLVQRVCSVPIENSRVKDSITVERLKSLLNRGFALSLALNRWVQYGVHVVGRGDLAYPARLKGYLKSKAPSLLYYVGNEQLWMGGGMAFVGSRDISLEATAMIKKVVGECVESKMMIVSGGARGADQVAMRTAFECGGNVVAALSGDLLKTILVRENRDAIAQNQLLLFSAVDPETRFSPINAMDRNKYIYAMADYALVAQSDTKGGTWSGAIEELKRPDHHPVYAYIGNMHTEGCTQLVAKGAIPWKPMDKLQSMLENNRIAQSHKIEMAQLSLFDFQPKEAEAVKSQLNYVSEPQERCYAEEKKENLYTAVRTLIENALMSNEQTAIELRKRIDPDGYFSLKVWKQLLEKVCDDGYIMRRESYKKRGKPKILYSRKSEVGITRELYSE